MPKIKRESHIARFFIIICHVKWEETFADLQKECAQLTSENRWTQCLVVINETHWLQQQNVEAHIVTVVLAYVTNCFSMLNTAKIMHVCSEKGFISILYDNAKYEWTWRVQVCRNVLGHGASNNKFQVLLSAWNCRRSRRSLEGWSQEWRPFVETAF